MSIRIIVDEDSQAKPLVDLLRDAGHDVVTVKEANLTSKSDPDVLDYARQEKRVLLTHNNKDFLELHELNSEHIGILAIYRNSDYSKK